MSTAYDPDAGPLAPLSVIVSLPAPTATARIISAKTYEGDAKAASGTLRAPEEIRWQDLRDYVLAQIEIVNGGPFPYNPGAMIGIFKGFWERWGSQSQPIARYAFEVEMGYWRGAPIMPGRFTLKSDPYFAQPIAARLALGPVTVAGWS